MGLVPGASFIRDEERYNSIDRDREMDRDRDRGRDRDSDHRRDSRRDDSRERGSRNDYDARRRARSPSPYERSNRTRDEDRRQYERDDRPKRASPDYSSYRREEPPHLAANSGDMKAAPWRAHENMYGSRNRGRPAGGEDFFASRRAERASKEVNIWPPSPKEPAHDLSEAKKKRSSKRRRSSSGSHSEDSEDERERRRRKEKKRKEKRDKESRKEKHKRRHRREKSYDDDSEDDRRHRHRRSRSYRSDESSDYERRSRSRSKSEKRQERSRHKSGHSSHADTPPRSRGDEDEAEWVEKPVDSFVAVAEHTGKSPHLEDATKEEKAVENESDSEEVGPQPPPAPATKGKKVDERQYGGALLRGEGSAMAAFLQDGDTQARIPRRGEIGLTSDEIATFEAVGYVMSGSRHRRMNAVRMRKENQVISAEEKRGILKLQKEERERREAILRDEFRELVEEKLKGTAGVAPGASASASASAREEE